MPSEGRGRTFESCRVRHFLIALPLATSARCLSAIIWPTLFALLIAPAGRAFRPAASSGGASKANNGGARGRILAVCYAAVLEKMDTGGLHGDAATQHLRAAKLLIAGAGKDHVFFGRFILSGVAHARLAGSGHRTLPPLCVVPQYRWIARTPKVY